MYSSPSSSRSPSPHTVVRQYTGGGGGGSTTSPSPSPSQPQKRNISNNPNIKKSTQKK